MSVTNASQTSTKTNQQEHRLESGSGIQETTPQIGSHATNDLSIQTLAKTNQKQRQSNCNTSTKTNLSERKSLNQLNEQEFTSQFDNHTANDSPARTLNETDQQQRQSNTPIDRNISEINDSNCV